MASTSATPLPWFDLDDYPVKAFERELQGVTTFAVIVGPDGRAADCQITQSSGHGMLDRQACWVAVKRARFTPAYGSDGRPTFGVYRSQVVWARPDRNLSMQRDLGPDLEVSVNQLPPGITQPLAVKVAYLVDPAGNPSACTPLPDSKGQPVQLVDVACQALFQQLPRQPVTAGGNAVPAVKTAAVRITASK
ncbi:MAG TPA: energy transducer TonB [Sphingomicrobium sp.]|nr:energy transducer TonB [Sphingomicrobium sp.]